MLYRHNFRRRARRSVGQFLSLAVIAATSQLLVRADVILADGNSVATIDPNSQQGLYNWSVDGQDQSFQQAFWGRIGNLGPEFGISSLGAPIIVTPDARTLNLTYANSQVQVQIIYSLLGGASGSGSSDVGEQIKITNVGGSGYDFNFFQYVDFDLLNTPGGDSVQLGKNLQNKFNEAFQSDGTTAFAETVAAPGADHGEVDLFPNTLNRLNDGLPTTLNDTTSSGPGDPTWAMQWIVHLEPGQTKLISKDLNLQVPEPSAVSLMTLGLIALGVLKRNRRQ
jgi:PEP-CTERM motif-containing protein